MIAVYWVGFWERARLHQTGPEEDTWPYKLGPVNREVSGNQTQTKLSKPTERETERERESAVMATFPGAASPARQPPGPEDEDPSLDEYDLYSLAHSYLGKSGPVTFLVPPLLPPHPQLGFLLSLLCTPNPFSPLFP